MTVISQIHSPFWRWSIRSVIFGLVMMFALITPFGPGPAYTFGLIFAGIPVLLWCGIFLWKWCGFLNRTFTALLTPPPNPAEIAVALEEHYGRPPTVQEVAAMHQMVMSKHHEDMLNGAIVIGGLFLMNHRDRL